MFAQTLKQLNEMHMVALAPKCLRAGLGYWSVAGFSASDETTSNEQDPIKMASFSKEFGTH